MNKPLDLRTWLVPVLMMLTTALLGGGTVAVLVDSDGDGPNPPKQVTITIPKAGPTEPVAGQPGTERAAGTVTDQVPKAPLDAIKASGLAEHEGQKDETPSEAQKVAPGQLQEAQEQRGRIRATQEPLATAGAAAGFAGCVSRFVRNQSSRNGVRPQLQVLHYTVSGNRPGWSDVNSIVSYFNGPGSQASSHFVIDREGNCAYIVPIEAKSWTQASANPISVSYEIINSGREGTFMDTAGYNKLRSVARQVASRTGIPAKAGRASGCSVSVKGIVQHKDFGICGGGHVDITPYSSAQVVKLIASGAVAASYRAGQPKHERLITDRRCFHFAKRFARGASKATQAQQLRYSRQWKTAAAGQKRRLDAAHAKGQPWSRDGIGTRRKLMAQTEAFTAANRKALCS